MINHFRYNKAWASEIYLKNKIDFGGLTLRTYTLQDLKRLKGNIAGLREYPSISP